MTPTPVDATNAATLSKEDIADAASKISPGVRRFLQRMQLLDLAPVFVEAGLVTDFGLEVMDKLSEEDRMGIWDKMEKKFPGVVKDFTKMILVHAKFSS